MGTFFCCGSWPLSNSGPEVKLSKKSLPGPRFSPRSGYALRITALSDLGGPMCETRFALAASQQPWTISPSPRPGRDVFSRLAAETLGAGHAACIAGPWHRPAEFGAVDPHAVQDDGEFATATRSLAQAFAFCNAHTPGFKSGPPCDPCQQHIGRFIEIAS